MSKRLLNFTIFFCLFFPATLLTMQKLAFFLLVVLVPVALAQIHGQCIPDCKPGDVPPNQGGPPCTCLSTAALPGCRVSPCKAGENSDEEYTCACTPEIRPTGCVNPRCTNGTEVSSATASNGPASDTFMFGCGNLCKCEKQPADCTKSSGNPSDGAPACTCTPDNWLTGCTMRPCRRGDNHDLYWFCECTAEYAPDFCYTPQCESLING